MSKKTVLITGATDGIGKATAEELARRGVTVILHGRSLEKVHQAQDEIRRKVPNASLEAIVADFASLEEVRALSKEIVARFEQLDVLINNAGVFMQQRKLSQDGFELTFAVNHLAHFLLTCNLLPLLRASQARVVTLSSISHRRGQINFADLQSERSFEGYLVYAQSKLANILFANELAARERGKLTSNSLHPGGVTSKLLQTGFGITGISPAQGAQTSVYLALTPEVANVTGKYFSESRETSTIPPVLDAAVGKKLWEVSEQLTAK
jgi:NAD(P)-dependent dehydrogenase (short-subunit alcohol dehydrogenase family)